MRACRFRAGALEQREQRRRRGRRSDRARRRRPASRLAASCRSSAADRAGPGTSPAAPSGSTFSSSRMLPGQACAQQPRCGLGRHERQRRRRAAAGTARGSGAASGRMSPRRSRSGGSVQHAPRSGGSRDPRGSGRRATRLVRGRRWSRRPAARRSGSAAREPSRTTSRSCSTRSSFTCSGGGSSPISSRNRVPPCAASNQPGLAPGRAGERAALVAEQLALDQGLAEGAAVDGHERPVAPRAQVVQVARDELLAGAGLAGDEHRRVAGRDLLDGREQAPGRRDPRRPGPWRARGARAVAGPGSVRSGIAHVLRERDGGTDVEPQQALRGRAGAETTATPQERIARTTLAGRRHFARFPAGTDIFLI